MKEENLIASSGSGTSLHAWNHSQKLAQLPLISADVLVPINCRAVIIAPHPDDEILACGGLMRQLTFLERPLKLISVTNGSASHPGSQSWPTERLSVIRPQESAEALRRLEIPQHSLQWIRGGFDDSAVASQEAELTEFLERYLRPTDVVFTTWTKDGHADHEATGRASIQAAMNVGALLHEVPLWAWHWADPEDPRLPWERARKIPLDPNTVARKRHAAHAFVSQLEGDPLIGLAPVLPPQVLERLLQPFEVVFM